VKTFFYWLVVYYLRLLAKLQLFKVKPLIIGITGSAGKSSLQNAVAAVLKNKYRVKVSEKANSETGIPLNILGFPGRNYSYADWFWVLPLATWKLLTNWEKYEIYVVELGVDSPRPPKNMGYLLTILKPKIGVFLNVLPVHTEAFEGLPGNPVDNIAKEKGKLITALPQDGWAVLNANDKRVISFKTKTKAQVVSFKKFKLELKNLILSDEYQASFAAALAVAKILGINQKQAVANLKKNFKLPPGRMSLIEGIKNTRIIDSSYNASRVPLIASLKTLAQIARGRKVAVLGDMRELGSLAGKEHRLVAQAAVKTTEVIVTVGPLMQKYFVPEVLRLGFKRTNLYSFSRAGQAAEALKKQIIQPGDTILVKGSQNEIFLEIVVEALMAKPQLADQLLCRRGRFWDKKRRHCYN
jgi:UDP-N-acetylmuramoyl-tripeptide--D-alanyl-D-alanine ligase